MCPPKNILKNFKMIHYPPLILGIPHISDKALIYFSLYSSTDFIKEDALMFKALERSNSVVIVGCLNPLSSRDMYVRSYPANSASFS